MFNKEFYPTPDHIIKKMIEPYVKKRHIGGINGYQQELVDLDDLYILEPSAGKGNIIDYIKKQYEEAHHRTDKIKWFCLELEPELQSILRDKEHNLIGSDFLNFKSDTLFDLIIMNPPFSNGDEHLLKAWDLMYKGDIICLLNKETINNPYTEKRKLLKSIIEQNGTTEDLGTCFDTAERKTNVEVVLIRLHKEPKGGDDRFTFHMDSRGTENSPDLSEDNIKKDEVQIRDVIGNLVIQYGQLQEAFIKFLQANKALNYYSEGLLDNYTRILELATESLNGSDISSFNNFSDKIKSNAWRVVIEKSGIEKYMTSGAHKEFQTFIKEQGNLPFTKENIYGMIRLIVENSDKILEKAIEEVFDIFTKYHNENRCHVEGWKTNDAWKVNRKIILPNWVRYGEYSSQDSLKQFGDNFNTSYSREYTDIDKALCYITGKKYEKITSVYEALETHFRIIGKVYPGTKFDNTCESTFFTMKFFKKGTLHITFKDEKLWEEFNVRATRMKKWLPHVEYDEWKRKQNGGTVIKKEKRLEANCPEPIVKEGQYCIV